MVIKQHNQDVNLFEKKKSKTKKNVFAVTRNRWKRSTHFTVSSTSRRRRDYPHKETRCCVGTTCTVETGRERPCRIIYEVSCRTCRIHRKAKGVRGRLVSRSGFRPFISNCEAALSRRASRASWSGRLLDDASDQYRRPASHWPLLLGAVENRPGDDGQEEAGGRRRRKRWSGPKGVRDSRADLPSFLPSSILPQPPAILCSPFWPSFSRSSCSFLSSLSPCDFFVTRIDATRLPLCIMTCHNI